MRYVIGLGTGRSGTASLAALLDAQDGVHVGHEQAPCIPWTPDGADYDRALRWLNAQKGPIAGDVAHAWISLLPQLADHASVRCIALRRDVDTTVKSFCRHMPDAYIQTDALKGALQFPTYDLPPELGWRRYVEAYYIRFAALADYVTVLPIGKLNSEEGQAQILSAAGISYEDHNYLGDCHYNASHVS